MIPAHLRAIARRYLGRSASPKDEIALVERALPNLKAKPTKPAQQVREFRFSVYEPFARPRA